VRLSPLGTSATIWPVSPATDDVVDDDDDDDDECGAVGGMIGKGHRNTRRKNCPSPALSTTNPTWPYLGSNPGCRCGKPATNRLSYGTAFLCCSLETAGCSKRESSYPQQLPNLPSRSTVLLEKPTVPQKFLVLIELECSLPCSQEPNTIRNHTKPYTVFLLRLRLTINRYVLICS
jgi:hypothetical protein